MESLLLLIISILPIYLIGIYLYKKDKEKEPTKLLVKLFIGGSISCILVLIITIILGFFFPILLEETSNLNFTELFFQVFFGIALIEEFCKWFIVYKISYHNQEFDEFYDIILYATFVSLGFACFENILYVFENGMTIALLRAITAIPGHVFDGILMGYFLGLAKLNTIYKKDNLRKKNLTLSILIPMITHGIYDFLIFSFVKSLNIIFFILFIIYMIIMYIISFKRIKKISSINNKLSYQNNYCSNCGKIVNSLYCPNCGTKK